ncbi:MAG: MerR family transcriptional regulator [Anoxybacillus sp.]|nr:MerR family transcriptional regulator [Anoxybacillus sp.]MCL6585921.1 MerR family transcriptional regulator [Anoxybacillus sp.]
MYNMKAVEAMVGIPAGTIRMWERRYQIITPQRSESGHRLYTDEQVELLRKIVAKTKEGLTVRQAIARLETKETTNDAFASCVQAAASFDARQLQQIWDEWMSIYSLEKVVGEQFPSLYESLSRTGSLTNAQRQFAYTVLASKLRAMLFTFSSASKQTALAIAHKGESLPLLFVAAYLSIRGIRVVYMNGCVSVADVFATVEQVKPAFLLFACEQPTDEEWLARIGANVACTVGVVGKGTEQHPRYIGKTKAEWEKKLHL